MLNVAQDAKCAPTLTLARRVDPMPHSHQISNVAATMDTLWIAVQIPASRVKTPVQHAKMLKNVCLAPLDLNSVRISACSVLVMNSLKETSARNVELTA